MTPPSGAIIAKPMLKRACGCVQEFQHYEVDKYRAQRQAKFESTRCPACAEKHIESQRIPSKVEALKLLPTGTVVTMEKASDGTWSGKMNDGTVTVVAKELMPQSILGALVHQWAQGQRPTDSTKK